MTNKNDNYKVKDIETADLGAIEMEIVGTDEDGEETVRIKGFSPAPTSLLQAIERIDRVVVEERLDKDALKAATPEIEYLAKRIGVSALQAVLFSVLVNHGSNMSISNLADHLSISNAQALSLLKEMKELERLHLLEIDDSFSGITFSIPSRVLIQLSRNKDFKHERTTGLDSGEFLTYVHNIFTKVYDNDIDREQLIEEIQNLLGDNKKCNFVKALKKLRVNESYGLVMLMLSSALYVDDRELMGINLLRPCAQNTAQYKAWKRDLRAGTHDLMKKDLIEFGCEDGIANNEEVMSTIKERYPTIHLTAAISNISFNLPVRKLVNLGYVVLAMKAGLDSGILDPTNRDMMGVIFATTALLGEDDFCMEYIEAYRDGIFGPKKD